MMTSQHNSVSSSSSTPKTKPAKAKGSRKSNSKVPVKKGNGSTSKASKTKVGSPPAYARQPSHKKAMYVPTLEPRKATHHQWLIPPVHLLFLALPCFIPQLMPQGIAYPLPYIVSLSEGSAPLKKARKEDPNPTLDSLMEKVSPEEKEDQELMSFFGIEDYEKKQTKTMQ
eukprot:15365699-Ditylum_brightwellii.AAC.3